MERDLAAIIKAYDVRGIYPDQLDAELAERVGGAFAVVVGSAMREIEPDAIHARMDQVLDAVLSVGGGSQGGQDAGASGVHGYPRTAMRWGGVPACHGRAKLGGSLVTITALAVFILLPKKSNDNDQK